MFIKIWDIFITIFSDSKIGTISLWSMPTRMLSRNIIENQDLKGEFTPYEPTALDLQYLNESTLSDMRHHIANEARRQVVDKLSKAWSVYHIQDGSVSNKQDDNYFQAAKYVDFYTGEMKYVFTGVVLKEDYGAKGQVKCMEKCLARLYPEEKKLLIEMF